MLKDCLRKTLGRYSFLLSARPGWLPPRSRRLSISIFGKTIMTTFRKLEDFRVQGKVHSLAVDLEMYQVYTPDQCS